MLKVTTAISLVTVAMTLSACAGGGGGGGSSTTAPTAPTTPTAPTSPSTPTTPTAPATPAPSAEYSANAALSAIGIVDGQSQIGTGVKIAILDAQFDVSHPELAGAIDPASQNVHTGKYTDLAGVNSPLSGGDQSTHGTQMAGAIGARRDGSGIEGVAPGSTLLLVGLDRAACGAPCISSPELGLDYAVKQGAKVANLSFTFNGSTAQMAESDPLAVSIRAAAPSTLLVVGAGNNAQGTPNNPALYVGGGNATGATYGIVVGAVDANGKLYSYSNAAGITKNAYVVAPGYGKTTTVNGGYVEGSGTSQATAIVSGLAGLIYGQNPQLTPAQVANIIFTTANDLGDPGVDAVYGHGMVNAAKALAPVGVNYVPTGSTVSAGGAALSASYIVTTPGMGETIKAGLADSKAVFLDGYDRAFNFDMAGLIHEDMPRTTRLLNWVQSISAPSASGAIGALRFSFSGQGSTTLPRMDDIGQLQAGFQSATTLDQLDRIDSRQSGAAVHLSYQVNSALGFDFSHQAGEDDMTASFGLAPVRDDVWALAAGTGDKVGLGGTFGSGFRWTAAFASGSQYGHGATGARAGLSYDMGGAQFDFAAAFVDETGGWGNVLAAGALGLGQAQTTQFETGLTVPVARGVSLSLEASLASTAAGDDAGIIRPDGMMMAMGWHAVAHADSDDGVWSISVAQPNRLVGAHGVISIPTGRLADGSITHDLRSISLEPTGREVQIQAAWQGTMSATETLSVAGMLATEPQHDALAAPELSFGLRYTARF